VGWLASTVVLVGSLGGCGEDTDVSNPGGEETASSEQPWVNANRALDGQPTSEPPTPPGENEAGPPSAPDPPTDDGDPPRLDANAESAVVTRIVDGDTLELLGKPGGALLPTTAPTTVRLLEIDTPETKHPSEPRQCFGDQAAARLTELAPPGQTVWVRADRELLDPYDRHLLYVWVMDGETPVFVNEAMVAGGYAKAVLYEPNDRYIDLIRQAERRARTASLGLWKQCSYFGAPLGMSRR
jgi:micrococcal nuclease